MALVRVDTQRTTVATGSEVTLTTLTPTSPTAYVLRVSAANLAAGEVMDIYAYTITLSGGTERLENVWRLDGNDAIFTFISEPIPTDVSLRFAADLQVGSSQFLYWTLFSL